MGSLDSEPVNEVSHIVPPARYLTNSRPHGTSTFSPNITYLLTMGF